VTLDCQHFAILLNIDGRGLSLALQHDIVLDSVLAIEDDTDFLECDTMAG